MAATQDELRTALERRLGTVERPPSLTAFAVVRELDVAAYVEGAIAFTLDQPPDLRRAWYDSYTRTAFLAGNCARLADRHRAHHATADGSLGWFGPAPEERFDALRRLLRAFHGDAPADVPSTPVVVTAPGEPANGASRHRLSVAVGGLTTLEYMVHLNHAVCDCVALGLIEPGDRVELVHPDAIDEPAERWGYARVGNDPSDPERLRLHACLTTPDGGG